MLSVSVSVIRGCFSNGNVCCCDWRCLCTSFLTIFFSSLRGRIWWVIICCWRWCFSKKLLPQSGQACRLLPEWIISCCFRLLLFLNPLSQWAQRCGRWSVCTSMCCKSVPANGNTFPHCGHRCLPLSCECTCGLYCLVCLNCRSHTWQVLCSVSISCCDMWRFRLETLGNLFWHFEQQKSSARRLTCRSLAVGRLLRGFVVDVRPVCNIFGLCSFQYMTRYLCHSLRFMCSLSVPVN